MGRKTRYTKKLAKDICQRIAGGESVRMISADEAMPCRATILSWAIDPEHPFAAYYDRACEIRAEGLADEMMDIADDTQEDYRTSEDGGVKINHENINRSKLRIDARKWYASKLKPKRYGDKLAVETEGLTVIPAMQILPPKEIDVTPNKDADLPKLSNDV